METIDKRQPRIEAVNQIGGRYVKEGQVGPLLVFH